MTVRLLVYAPGHCRLHPLSAPAGSNTSVYKPLIVCAFGVFRASCVKRNMGCAATAAGRMLCLLREAQDMTVLGGIREGR
jgi:hypothetical protein